MIINTHRKGKITVQGSSWDKEKREKVYIVIRKLIQPFIFTVTTVARMEGEMNFLMIALHAPSMPTPNKHFVAVNNNNNNNNNNNKCIYLYHDTLLLICSV